MADTNELQIRESNESSSKEDKNETNTKDDSVDNAESLESPKPLAFTIDFGERKTVDTNRFKNLFEKYQNRHRRGKSLSKIESLKEAAGPVQNIKPPLSVNFPRKADYHSEGYFSSDQEDRNDHLILSKLRNFNLKSGPLNRAMKNDLTLPLQNTTTQRLVNSVRQNNFDLCQITSPEMDLKDISSPEFDILTPSEINPNMIKSMPEMNFLTKKSPGVLKQHVPSPNGTRKKESRNILVSFNLEQNGESFSNSKNNTVVKTPEDVEVYDIDENSDSVSEAGTYTLDADNYTEEQKARMSIDREFNISNEISSVQMTQSFVESTLQYVTEFTEEIVEPDAITTVVNNLNSNVQYNNEETMQVKLKTEQRTKMQVLSPQQSISIDSSNAVVDHQPISNLVKKNIVLNNIDSMKRNEKNTNKILFASKKSKNTVGLEQNVDEGCFTSITTCGVFKRDNCALTNSPSELSPEHKISSRRGSLTRTEIYCDNNISNVCTQHDIKQNIEPISIDVINISPKIDVSNNSKKPPMSPTKIPSPVNSLSRPRSRASLDLSDSSETDYYLKHTQNVITSLQARLISDQNKKIDQRKIAQNIIKNQTKHVRHNSFDSKNTHLISNKLENFQNKSLQQSIDQTSTNIQNQYSVKNVIGASRSPTHKLYNSPNNSPIRRSSSFSTKHEDPQIKYVNSPICSPRIQKESNLNRNLVKPNHVDISKVHRSSSTASIKKHLNPFRRNSANSPDRSNVDVQKNNSSNEKQLGSESSSEEEFTNNISSTKNKTNVINTRYNRTFSLRRARLDLEPVQTSKCPNTPEMKRKFLPNEQKRETVRSVSSEPRKTTEIQSRYMNIGKATTPKAAPKNIANNNVGRSPAATPRSANAAVKVGGGAIKNPVMARTDSGRFSIKTNKPKPTNAASKPTSKKGNRSNSTLTSREVDFQNWKRRKSYDPMKAAAEGKRRAELSKRLAQESGVMTQSYTETSQECDSSPSHSSSVHRSQSFHGTAGLDNYISSEDELTLSADDMEGITPPAPTPNIASPVKSANVHTAWYQRLY